MRREVMRPLEVTWEDFVLGGVASVFPDAGRGLEVEIGPGEDDFLLEQALAHPKRDWLGIEYSRKRVQRQVRKVRRRASDLDNLRLVWRPAPDLVRPFLVPGRVDAFHVYFPDPWPKKRHHRYRLLTPAFLGDLRDALRPGGVVHLATDDVDYLESVLEALEATPGLASAHPPPGFVEVAPGDRVTDFEARWRAMGRRIHRLDMRLEDAGPRGTVSSTA